MAVRDDLGRLHRTTGWLIVMIGIVVGLGIPTLIRIALLTNAVVVVRFVQARSALGRQAG